MPWNGDKQCTEQIHKKLVALSEQGATIPELYAFIANEQAMRAACAEVEASEEAINVTWKAFDTARRNQGH
jgi:hypothetical protein